MECECFFLVVSSEYWRIRHFNASQTMLERSDCGGGLLPRDVISCSALRLIRVGAVGPIFCESHIFFFFIFCGSHIDKEICCTLDYSFFFFWDRCRHTIFFFRRTFSGPYMLRYIYIYIYIYIYLRKYVVRY